jgi:anti-anti-sigma factor
LELAAAPAFKRELAELHGAGYSRFVLDFAQVSFFDSTALGVLIGFNRSLGETALLALANLSPSVKKVFDVTGVDRVLNVFGDVQAAIDQIGATAASPGDGGAHPRPGLAHAPPGVAHPSPGVADPPPGSIGPQPTAGPQQTQAAPLGLEDVHAALTEDAAVVLGIAATAIPFAPSLDAQAERWLRALRNAGEAGMALAVLGASDAALERAPDPSDAGLAARLNMGADVVATVAQHARRIANQRQRPAIHTDDLLGAVADVYGPVFDRVLARHGVGRDELLAQMSSGL